MSSPAQPIQTQDPNSQADPQAAGAQPGAPAPDPRDVDSNAPDETSGEPVKIQRAYSRMNEALCALFDGLGIKRVFTSPYVDGASTESHIQAVGSAAASSGLGLTKTLLTTFHHSGGRGFGYGDGATVAHPADALRSTLIPHDSEKAIAAISACRSLLNDIEKLLGKDDTTIKVAKAQLALVSKHDSEGMTALDVGISLQQLVHLPLQSVARGHNETKQAGPGHPKLQAPMKRTPKA
jgi:hypothetical protein